MILSLVYVKKQTQILIWYLGFIIINDFFAYSLKTA